MKFAKDKINILLVLKYRINRVINVNFELEIIIISRWYLFFIISIIF